MTSTVSPWDVVSTLDAALASLLRDGSGTLFPPTANCPKETTCPAFAQSVSWAVTAWTVR